LCTNDSEDAISLASTSSVLSLPSTSSTTSFYGHEKVCSLKIFFTVTFSNSFMFYYTQIFIKIIDY